MERIAPIFLQRTALAEDWPCSSLDSCFGLEEWKAARMNSDDIAAVLVFDGGSCTVRGLFNLGNFVGLYGRFGKTFRK